MKSEIIHSEEAYLYLLRYTYAFRKELYSMSFKDRLYLKMGVTHISVSPSKEINSWTREELECRLKEQKKTWWNWLF